jgi:geranylgeranyl pyrophosphate synthase
MNGHGAAGLDPLAATEAIAYDFLAKGGKHSRPFITLAVHDALTGGVATAETGAQVVEGLSDSVKRAALSIETFHKASLVHDDIEDNDAFRYGDLSVHQRFGIPTAINVGDYLIGLGYRLISREAPALGADVASDVLDKLADAHMRLSEGQGAELLWRDSLDKRLKPIDALKIYALKTAPAFEAALFAGMRIAGGPAGLREALSTFARNLGVAFQIQNDLADWNEGDHNKRLAGGDVLGGRPTVLWALALESLGPAQREELEALAAQRPVSDSLVHRVRQLYEAAGVFEQAEQLVEKYRQRAEAVADETDPESLRALLYYLVDTVLERPVASPPVVVPLVMPNGVPASR